MHVHLLAPTILPLSTVCIRSRHARHAGVQLHVVLWHARALAPTILPLSTSTVCIRSRHARHAGVPSIKDQLGIWERDQLWDWSHRKFWKKRDGASWFWEILFPFAGAPAKCRRNGQFRQIRTAIRVGQKAKVLKISSSFGPVCGIYNGAQMGNDRQTEPELKRRGPTRVCDRCINASVTCDPRQNKALWTHQGP